MLFQVPVQLSVVAAGRAHSARPHPGLPFWWRGGDHLITNDSHPLNDSLTLKIVEHEVLCTAVVPDGNSALGPPVTHGKSRVADPAGEVTEQRITFGGIQFHNTPGEMLINVQGFFAGDGMHSNYRMNGGLLGVIVRMCIVECGETIAE